MHTHMFVCKYTQHTHKYLCIIVWIKFNENGYIPTLLMYKTVQIHGYLLTILYTFAQQIETATIVSHTLTQSMFISTCISYISYETFTSKNKWLCKTL